MLIAFNKPYGVISQFSSDSTSHRTLAEFHFPRAVYPIGRLDVNSEGLLLLSDEPASNKKLLHPSRKHRRLYWVQVENNPSKESLSILERGIVLQDRKTLPCRAYILNPQPTLPKRIPPIRFRKNIPTCWIALELFEGKNHQVRRMTAAIGYPTLRLIRVGIGNYFLGSLNPGEWITLAAGERRLVFVGHRGDLAMTL